MYGFGATCAAQQASIFSGELWDYILHGCPPPSTVAPPRAPTGDALTLPPASGEDAAALAQSIADQQMRDQQALDRTYVKSTWFDQFASDVVDTGDAIKNPLSGGIPTWAWVAGAGLAVFAVVAIGSGSPRRYGR